MRFLRPFLALALAALSLSLPSVSVSASGVDVSVTVSVPSSHSSHAVSDRFMDKFQPLIEENESSSEVNDALTTGPVKGKRRGTNKKSSPSSSSAAAAGAGSGVGAAAGTGTGTAAGTGLSATNGMAYPLNNAGIMFIDQAGNMVPEARATHALVPDRYTTGSSFSIEMEVYRAYLTRNPTPAAAALRTRVQPVDKRWKATTPGEAYWFIAQHPNPSVTHRVSLPGPFYREVNGIRSGPLMFDDNDDDDQPIPSPNQGGNGGNNGGNRPDPVPSTSLSWLNAARAELGVRERRGPASNPRINAYWNTGKVAIAANLKQDNTPWCAAFVGAMLEKSGIPSTRSAAALSYRSWGTRLSGPAVGAVAVFNRGKGKGHVGFVVGKTAGGQLLVLGGNQADMVKVSTFLRGRTVTFQWPRGQTAPTRVGWDSLPVLDSDGQISIDEV